MLERVLEAYANRSDFEAKYARYASITQSSGTGKSRMVDELAKKMFCIPMNLSATVGSAYPLFVICDVY